mmetsp:Transcript_33068/g.52974  ORF Transcript_33068/g.52974 Transcript_33068/m.52974 type:complete len:356 (-) Transcript_33068:49-1116(-)
MEHVIDIENNGVLRFKLEFDEFFFFSLTFLLITASCCQFIDGVCQMREIIDFELFLFAVLIAATLDALEDVVSVVLISNVDLIERQHLRQHNALLQRRAPQSVEVGIRERRRRLLCPRVAAKLVLQIRARQRQKHETAEDKVLLRRVIEMHRAQRIMPPYLHLHIQYLCLSQHPQLHRVAVKLVGDDVVQIDARVLAVFDGAVVANRCALNLQDDIAFLEPLGGVREWVQFVHQDTLHLAVKVVVLVIHICCLYMFFVFVFGVFDHVQILLHGLVFNVGIHQSQTRHTVRFARVFVVRFDEMVDDAHWNAISDVVRVFDALKRHANHFVVFVQARSATVSVVDRRVNLHRQQILE